MVFCCIWKVGMKHENVDWNNFYNLRYIYASTIKKQTKPHLQLLYLVTFEVNVTLFSFKTFLRKKQKII